MMDNNAQSLISVPPGNEAGEPVDIDEALSSYIRALEAELRHYRLMLEKMVQQRTEKLDRRISILESCNRTLCENYHKIQRQHLNLLNNFQSFEAGIGGGAQQVYRQCSLTKRTRLLVK